MKIRLLFTAILSFSSLSFADSGIATMFSCYSAPDSSGKYFSFGVSTRGFDQITVDVYQMKESRSGDDEQLDYKEGVRAGRSGTKNYANGRSLQGYDITSDITGPAKVYFATKEFDALAADTTGRVHGKSVGHLDIGKYSEVIRCEY